MNSQKSRDFPTPGSPTSATTAHGRTRLLERPAKRLQLGVAPNERRQATRRSRPGGASAPARPSSS